MTLRHAKSLTIGLMVVGGLLFALAAATGEGVSMTTGGLLLLVGALLMRTPIAVLEEGELRRKNALGMTLKRFPVAGPADLRLDGTKVVHVATGKTAATLGFGTDADDAAQWRAWLGGAPQQ